MSLTKYRLGDLITQRREKYDGDDIPVRGVSREGFISPKQSVTDFSLYNLFYRGDFVFNPARMEVNSIAYNPDIEKGTCSSLYEVFYVSRPEILLPEYLNIYIKRDEFARLCSYIGWGSAREYCRVADISELEISLPSLETQIAYAGAYEGLRENQRCYEQGLDDLRLTCDAFIEKLLKTVTPQRIAPFISEADERNEGRFGLDSVRGISIEKKFIPTKAKMDGVNLSSYKCVKPNAIAYVTVTSRNSNKITIALNDTTDTFIVSGTYVVFEVDQTRVLPEYLMLFFCRSEFDRYARFNSWGSARETFDWDDMKDVEIPIPSLEVQRAIADVYIAFIERKRINDQLKSLLRDVSPILLKGAIDSDKR